ncbi:pyrroline-5-carboxylate reductase [Candidatus Sumerlaeota bacterium]|nr:pyrroline-5-carboxylate reductase [Candidatus Sumerlaeota bacterium]
MAEKELRIGSIGAGNMATALLGGIVKAGIVKADDCLACDVLDAAREKFTQATSLAATDQAERVMRQCDIILLAVKPFVMLEALAQLKPFAEERHLFISIAAGIRANKIEATLGGAPRVIRVMPNTPALLACGAAGVSKGANATDADMALALQLMNAVGVAIEVPEENIDAVTGVSGSGPAYFFYFVEQTIKAGVAAGLEEKDAELLAKQTMLGAARMLMERPETPEELRRAVTTPNGTTAAALKVFEDAGLNIIFENAVQAATNRSRELADT